MIILDSRDRVSHGYYIVFRRVKRSHLTFYLACESFILGAFKSRITEVYSINLPSNDLFLASNAKRTSEFGGPSGAWGAINPGGGGNPGICGRVVLVWSRIDIFCSQLLYEQQKKNNQYRTKYYHKYMWCFLYNSFSFR